MSDNALNTWENVQIGLSRKDFAAPYIQFYSEGMRLNAAFVKAAKLDSYDYVSVRVLAASQQVGFWFHNDVNLADKAKLTKTYGRQRAAQSTGDTSLKDQKKSVCRIKVRLGRLYALPSTKWLADVVKTSDMHLPAKKDPATGLWVVEVKPAFSEQQTLGVCIANLREDNRIGTYKLFDASGRMVYVGEGVIRERLKEHILTKPVALFASYTQSLTKAQAVQMQNELIAQHVVNHGSRPQYNLLARAGEPK